MGVIQFTQYVEQNHSITKTVKFFLNGFGLRSASGGSEVQVERRLERNWSVFEIALKLQRGRAGAEFFWVRAEQIPGDALQRGRARAGAELCGPDLLLGCCSGLQRGRARAGAEFPPLPPATRPRLSCFNGAAPARARNFIDPGDTINRMHRLQRGRARAGAEFSGCLKR